MHIIVYMDPPGPNFPGRVYDTVNEAAISLRAVRPNTNHNLVIRRWVQDGRSQFAVEVVDCETGENQGWIITWDPYENCTHG